MKTRTHHLLGECIMLEKHIDEDYHTLKELSNRHPLNAFQILNRYLNCKGLYISMGTLSDKTPTDESRESRKVIDGDR